MKTKTFSALLVAVILALASCKKEQNQSGPRSDINTITDNKQNRKKVTIPQKIYDLTPQQVVNLVKTFKSGIQNKKNNEQARLIEADSLTVDSAVNILEATLNFDFDRANLDNDEESYEWSMATVEFSVSFGDGAKVNSDDLEEMYGDFGTSIAALEVDGKKIHMIDIEAYVYDPAYDVVYLKATAGVMKSTVRSTCAPWEDIAWAPYASPGWGPLINMGINSTNVTAYPDAIKELDTKLNCTAFNACENGYYFYPILLAGQWAVLPNYNPAPSALLQTPYYNVTNWAGNLGYVSQQGLNNFRAGLLTLISGSISSPWNKCGTQLISGSYANTNSPVEYSLFWNFKLWKGKINCREIPLD